MTDVIKKEDLTDNNDGDLQPSGEDGSIDADVPATQPIEPAEKTFTQSQVNRLMANEKRQGRASVLREIGIDPKDTQAIKELREYVESKKTDAQRDAEVQREIAEANERAMVAEIKAQAMMLGAKPQYVDDLVTLAMPKLSEDGADIKTVIGEYKTKYGIWFGDESEDDEKAADKGGNAGKHGTGAALTGNGSQGSSKPSGLGARLAAQRRAGAKKQSSYWS